MNDTDDAASTERSQTLSATVEPSTPTGGQFTKKRPVLSPISSPRQANHKVTKTTASIGPIKGGDFSNRLKPWTRESEVAAYLFFLDLAEFRRAMLVFPVLNAYTVWREHSDLDFRVEVALDLLREDRGVPSEYPADLRVMVEKYGKKEAKADAEKNAKALRLEKHRRHCILACVLRYLVTQTNMLLQKDEWQKVEHQYEAQNRFEEQWCVKAPSSINILSVEVIAWGPVAGLGEERSEAYNRAFCLLRRLHHIIVNKMWDSQMNGKESFVSMPIPGNVIPPWMTNHTEEEIEHMFETVPASPRLPPHHFKLMPDEESTVYSASLEDHVKNVLGPLDLKLPEGTLRCNTDPRIYACKEEWLDLVRKQLNMVHLCVQFFRLTALLEKDGQPVTEGVGRQAVGIYGEVDRPWEGIKQVLGEFPESRLCYSFRPLVDGDLPLEYVGPVTVVTE